MSDSLRAEDMGGQSAVSSAVRFAEYMAEKLAAGRVAMGLEGNMSGRQRLSSEDAETLYTRVLADVKGGVSVAVASKRHGVTTVAFRSWANRRLGGIGRKAKR